MPNLSQSRLLEGRISNKRKVSFVETKMVTLNLLIIKVNLKVFINYTYERIEKQSTRVDVVQR